MAAAPALAEVDAPARPVVGPDPNYQPKLIAPVFNVKDYGARGNNLADDTDAIRAALAACRQAGGGTVYLPAGTYKVAPKEEGGFAFPLHFGNLTIEGDGPTATVLNFRAWGMKNPANLILKRGGGFTTYPAPGQVDGITLRGFRATGNAPPTQDAGKWWGDDSLTGWDITHKGLWIWGSITNFLVEDCEWDNWRGEVLYAGGGLELGKFTIRRTKVHGCNGSAISMGGDILVEDSDIYDVYNGTECLSMGGHQKLVVRRCVIEPNRNFVGDMKIGKSCVVYLGFRESSLLVEECYIGESQTGGVFLSESASNVLVRNNAFVDTTGVYLIYLNQYDGHTAVPLSEHNIWNNIEISKNRFQARTKNVEAALLSYISPGNNWRLLDNVVEGVEEYHYRYFISTSGANGEYLAKGNSISQAAPASDSNGPRPTWIDNTVTGGHENGYMEFSYLPASDLTPLTIRPTWPRIRIHAIGGGAMTREVRVDPAVMPLLPTGFPLEFRRIGTSDEETGAEIRPDPASNKLKRGYMLYRGAVLKLKKDANGLLELDSYTAPDVNIRTLTENEPPRPQFDELSFYGQREVVVVPRVRHAFRSHSGVAIGDTVTLRHNALTTIAHVPGVVEIFNGQDFVATESGTLLATREGEVLKILDLTPHAWMESQGLPGGTPWTSDPDGDGQPLLLEYALGGHSQANDSPLVLPRRRNGALQISFLWNRAASDLRYDVEASSDLRTWNPILTSNRGGPWTGSARFMLDEGSTGLTWMTVTDPVSTGSRFMRIRVEEP